MTDRPVKIRYREVIVRRPFYGRFGEYQVVEGRKVISRQDLRSHAERWATTRGYTVTADTKGKP